MSKEDAHNFRGECYKSCDTCVNLDYANTWCEKHEFDPNWELKSLPATHTVCDDWE
jgi:hypothetical protein